MTFNIGSQTGGVINNVTGDLRITGGQHGMVVGDDEARQASLDLRDGLAHTPLDQTQAAQAHARVQEVTTELQSPQPDRSRIARTLQRLTELLLKAGHLATTGAALVGPLRTLGSWLGALGTPLLHLLPVLA